MTSLLYVIRGPDRRVEAIHERIERSDGKRFRWWTTGAAGLPVRSLQGRKVRTLPLFGSQHVSRWDSSRPVFVVEGEKTAMALLERGYRALGTVGGSTAPGRELLTLLRGFDVLLWADNDDSGRQVMADVHCSLRSLASSVRWVIWAEAPSGGDAADYLSAGLDVDAAIAGAVRVPLPQAIPVVPSLPPYPAASHSSDVTDALFEYFGLRAVAGRSVKCPMHDDRRPSLSIFPDNKRAMCHAAMCAFNGEGHGVSAYDIRHLVAAVPA
jgi:hypothetical protein